jgi:hypothetical protein
LLERPGPHALIPLLRMVRDHVGHERACQALRLLIWIVREERVDRSLRGCRDRIRTPR